MLRGMHIALRPLLFPALALLVCAPAPASAQPAEAPPAADAPSGPIEAPPDAPPPPAGSSASPSPRAPVRLALQGATHRLLRLGAEAPSVDFPFDVSGEPPALNVAVLEATFGSPPASADGIFTAGAVADPRGPRVRIVGDPAQLRTGAYTLRLRLTGPGVATYEPSVQISVPAPELRHPQTLSVQRIRPLLPAIFGAGDASAEPLVLREIGRFAGLTAVRLTQLGPLTLGDRPEVGTIYTAAELPDLLPGGTQVLDYTVEPRNLPAGTVRGTLQLSARELAEPIEIAVEVVTRVAPIWIVFVVLVGVLLGYISRQVLGRWRARNDALALAAVERRAVIALGEAATDGVFRTQLEQIRDALDRAIAGRDPTTIADAAAAARTAREAARAALEARHAALSDRFGDVVARLTGRPLPRSVVDRLDGRLPPIRDALLARQTDRAEGLLAALTGGAGLTALRSAWRDWQLDARQALGTVDRLGDLAELDSTAAVTALQTLSGDADFDPLFTDGAAAFEAVHHFTAEAWVELDRSVEQVLVLLGGAIDAATGAGIRDVLGRARTALVAGGSPAEALRLMTTEVPTALGAAIGNARPANEARQLLARRRYRAAAATFSMAGEEIPESSVRGVAATVPVDGRGRSPSDPPPGPAGWARDLDVARLALAESPPPAVFTPPKPWLAEVLGSLINAVVIALVAYVVYAEDFVGNGSQLISTLLWAYGMDLGAEAVKTQLQRVTPGGGT